MASGHPLAKVGRDRLYHGSRGLVHLSPEGGSEGSESSSPGPCTRPDTIGRGCQGNITLFCGDLT